MKVPVRRTPQTSVQPVLEGYARAVPGLDFSAVNEALGFASQALEAEQKQMEELDLNKRFIEETNELQLDFIRRQQEAPLGAAGFTEQVTADYEARHKALKEEFWQRGYDEDRLEAFDMRLATLRSKFSEDALGFQLGSFKKLGQKNFDEMALGLSQLTAANPDAYGSAVLELEANRPPGFSDVEWEDVLGQGKEVLKQGAMKSIAFTNPGLVIRSFDPQGYTAPIPMTAAGATPGAGSVVPAAAEVLRKHEGFRETPYWDVNHHRVGYGSDTVTLVDGTVRKVTPGMRVTREDAERDLARRAAELGQTAEQKTGGRFAALPEGAKTAIISVAYNYGSESKRLVPIWRAVENGDVNRVAMLIESFAGDNNGINARRRREEAQLARSILPTNVPMALETFDPGPSTAPAIGPGGVARGTEPVPADASALAAEPPADAPTTLEQVQTGHPLLDALNGAERVQVLGWARESMNRTVAQARGELEVEHDNAVSAYMATGEWAGPVRTEADYVATWGPVVGPQKWAERRGWQEAGQFIQRSKTLSPAQLAAEVEKLKPVQGSQTYAQDQQKYAAADQAMRQILDERKRDPAGYVLQAFPNIARQFEGAKTSDQRKAAYQSMRNAYAQLGVPKSQQVMMSDEQLRALGTQYELGTSTEKLSLIEQTIYELGSQDAGRALGKSTGKEVVQDLELYSMLRQHPSYRTTFLDIMNGREIIKNDSTRRPPADKVNKVFSTQFKTTINNLTGEYSRMLNDNAAALYVQRGGKPDMSDRDLYIESMREALGGIPGNKNTGIVDLSQGQVKDLTILPAGVTKQKFENWVETRTAADFLRLSVQPGDSLVSAGGQPIMRNYFAENGVFVQVAPNVYEVKDARTGLRFGSSRGGPFRLRINSDDVR